MNELASLREENEKLRQHLERLKKAAVIIYSDWWPLVHERTSRETVRKQGKMLRDAIENN